MTASRVAQPIDQVPFAVDFIAAQELQSPAVLTADAALRRSPAFSLFRRDTSLTANPTAQGVSLRGVGPSGASRSLVLWDGIPLNDPFGGWVAWAKIPSQTLAGAEVMPGGGAGVWGNAALGGVLQLLSADALSAPHHRDRLVVDAGTHDTVKAEALAYPVAETDAALQFGARWFSTDGFHQFAPEQRGTVDRPLESRHRLLHGLYARKLPRNGRFEIGARWFDEERGNGTPLRRNESREAALHLRWSTEISPDASLEVLGYAQTQKFAASFSAVGPERNAESPVLDQFDVPANALGFAAVATWRDEADRTKPTTTAGIDFRAVRGETREAYFYNADDARFLRRRFAGGKQRFGGAFVNHQRWLTDALAVQVSGRIDLLQNRDGHRRDINVDTGAYTVFESYADLSETEFTPAVGAVWQVASNVRVRAAARRGFRLPTLNEYYRPFRVGDVTTNANPALAVESLAGFDGAIEIEGGQWDVSLGAFSNDFRDAVANVTLSTSPSGTTRQRLNLDRVSVAGVEARAVWRPHPDVSLALAYLHTDAKVDTATVAPSLVGRELPQVPRHVATATLRWRYNDEIHIEATGRSVSRQFEDDANLLPLAAVSVFDAAIVWSVNHHVELRFAVENLSAARIETGRDAGGLVDLAPSRSMRIGAAFSR